MTETDHDPQKAVQELIDELVSAMMNARVYFAAHPRVQLSIEQLASAITNLTAATREPTLRLAVAGGYILFDNRPVVGASLAAGRLIETLQHLGSGGLELSAQCGVDEIRTLVEALSARHQERGSYARLNTALAAQIGDRVRFLPPFRAGEGGAGAGGSAESSTLTFEDRDQLGVDSLSQRAIELPTRLYQNVLGLLQDITVTACQGGSIPIGSVFGEAERLLKELDSASGPLLGLAAQHEYDAFTLGHSMRVTVLAMDFARGLGASPQACMAVGVAGLLHDVGKAHVPFEILHSRRPLTAEERDLVNTHPEHGARMLLDQSESEPLAIAAAFGHHRRFDGEGYPRTMHAHRLSVTTRIVKICDVYEALTAARPYKPPMSAVRAYRIMISMAGHFDPWLLRRFIRRNGVYPTGSNVRLDTGEKAFVLEQRRDLLRPRVLVTTDRDGNELPWQERQTLDLSEPDAGVGIQRAEVAGTPADLATSVRQRAATESTPAHAHGSGEIVAGCCGPIITDKPAE
ncbi:MAG: HD domain-containing protein [Planctomycetota bacterium]